MKDIVIQPFPNYRISDEAVQKDVIGNSHELPPNSKDPKSTPLMSVSIYNNGEKRVNAIIPEIKNDKTFMSVFPNPIQLYLSFAIECYNGAEKLRDEEFIKTPKRNGKVYYLDSDSDKTNPVYTTYLKAKVGSLIMLTCALEAFVNSLISKDASFTNDRLEILDQIQIQRRYSLKSKISKVIPALQNKDFKDESKKDYDRLNSLIRIRNEFVHLKNYDQIPSMTYEYQKLFLSMKKFKFENCINAVKRYMNYHTPNLIVEEKI